jgi:predicted secreted hydrolase
MRRRPLPRRPARAGDGARACAARAPLAFPRDFGAHPDLRTEWWYVTGFASAGGREFGFQLTFFRTRVDGTQGMQSAFAARQLVFAHAALTDVQGRACGTTSASRAKASASRRPAAPTPRCGCATGTSRAPPTAATPRACPRPDFGLDLRFTPTQPVLLQGRAGLSRKGPSPEQASYYYSEPQLAAAGTCHAARRALRGEGQGPGWTTSGARRCCIPTPWAGTGSA